MEGWVIVVDDMVGRELAAGGATAVVVQMVRVAGICIVLKWLGVCALFAMGAPVLIWAGWVIIWVAPTAGLKICVPGAEKTYKEIVVNQ